MKKVTEKPLTNDGNVIIMKLRFNRNSKNERSEHMAIEKITLPAARKMANLTQKGLADACGVSESTVCNWEKGRTEPSVSQAKRIGEVCGIHYDDIIFLTQVTV